MKIINRSKLSFSFNYVFLPSTLAHFINFKDLCQIIRHDFRTIKY